MKRGVLLSLVVILVIIALILKVNYTNAEVYENRYNFTDLPENFSVSEGKEFFLDIDFEEGYTFSDDTPYFDIEKETGRIHFNSNGESFQAVIIVLKGVDDFHYKLLNFLGGDL